MMTQFKLYGIALLVAVAHHNVLAQATVYSCKDTNGRITFSQIKCPSASNTVSEKKYLGSALAANEPQPKGAVAKAAPAPTTAPPQPGGSGAPEPNKLAPS